jgi:hypothetical protein
MATISYTFISRCAGGGHTTLDVSVNSGAANRAVYETDDVRAPLSLLTDDERKALALLILKIHFAGMTRAQVATEFQAGPVVVTI